MNFAKHKKRLSLAIASSVLAVSFTAQADSKRIDLNIDSKPTNAALLELAEAGGIHIIFSPDVIKGYQSPSVHGSLTLDVALQQLLSGTSLDYEMDGENVVLIREKQKDIGQSREVLEEIIVTATKRAESLQDIPVAVSAFSTDDIEEQGIENFQDFARQLPGVSLVQTRKNRSQFIIRGITTGQAGSRSQDEVATYIDDASVTSSYFASVLPDLRLFDIQRVEVLRGPQGTLFGSGSLGGAVRVITNKPDSTSFDTASLLDTGYTKGGSVRARYSGMVNIPLIENELAVRAVGYYRDEDGYINNIGTGVKNANSTTDWGGRVMLDWTPTEKLHASFMVLAQNSEPKDSDQIDPNLGEYTKSSTASGELIGELRIYNAVVDYDLGFATLSSTTTYSQSLGSSFGGFNFLTNLLSKSGQDSEFVTEEIKLVSQSDGPFEWTLGAYYFDQQADQWEFIDIEDPIGFANDFNVTGLDENGRIAGILSALEAREKALFGEVSWHLNDEFTLTTGLRYSKSNMHFVNFDGYGKVGGFVAVATTPGGGDINDFPIAVFDQDVRADSSVLTGKISLSYQPNENQNLYLLASKGYRVGQANTVQGPDPIDPINGLNIPGQFGPDSLWNYEFGAKSTWLDGRFITNLAVYYIPWDNIQVTGSRSTDFVTYTGNAGEAVAKGIELETLMLPTDNLQLGLNITLQNAEITSVTASETVVTGAKEGDKLPNSPDFQVAGFAEYSWPVKNDWQMFARMDVQYIGSSRNGFSFQAGSPGEPLQGGAENEAYQNINSSIALQTENWRFTFYVENLTDNGDLIYSTPTLFDSNRFNVLRPRTVGIRLKYDY